MGVGECVKLSVAARFVPESVLSESYDRYQRYDGLYRYDRHHLHAPTSSFEFIFSFSISPETARLRFWVVYPLFSICLSRSQGIDDGNYALRPCLQAGQGDTRTMFSIGTSSESSLG